MTTGFAVSAPRLRTAKQAEASGSFAERMEREFCQGSAIAPELYAAAVEIIEDKEGWEPNIALGHKVSRFWETRKPHEFKAIAMLTQESGEGWQAKAQNPRTDYRKGSSIKYEMVMGTGSKAFLPAIDMKTWRKICDRNQINLEEIWLKALVEAAQSSELTTLLQKWSGFGSSRSTGEDGKQMGIGLSSSCSTGSMRTKSLEQLQKLLQPNTQELLSLQSGNPTQEVLAALCSFVENLPSRTRVPNFWKWLESRVDVSIAITEGGKKSLALLTQGYVAIALTGVNGGYRANERIGADVIPLERPELINCLRWFTVKGRRFILAFDQDEKQKTVAKVTGALYRFGGLLSSTGAEVSIASWKSSQGKGVDDLIVKCGPEAAEQAIAEALPFGQWAIARKLSSRVKRSADLNIGDREFAEVAGELPEGRDIALYGGKGTGKSKAIAKLLEGRSWLSITSLQSLAREQAESWGGAFINDGDRFGNKFLKDGIPVDGGSCCIPSLMKVQAIACSDLVIDETSAVLQFLHGSKLANKDGMRPILLAEFERRVREAERLIVADADMTEEVLQYLETVRGQRFHMVRSTRKPLRWTAWTLSKKNTAIAELLHRVETLPAGKLLYANFDEKAAANALAGVLKERGIEYLLITQETSGGEVERSFLSSHGRDIPELLNSRVKVIITSPSVTQGFSIEHHTDCIDSVWGIYAGTSISAQAIAQSLDRVRAPIDRFIFLPNKGKAYSRLSKALNQKDWTSEFKVASNSNARIARLSLKPETTAAIETIDWQGENIKLLASFEVSRNQGMMALKDTVLALLRHEGKGVQPFVSQLPAEATKAAAAEVDAATKKAAAEREKAISSAETITDEQAQALEKKARQEPLAQAELLQLEKYYLAKFYRLEGVDTWDVAFDAKGKTRQQIRNLEALLDEVVAMDRTVRSIDATPTTPQDWDKAALRRWLLVQTGADKFLYGIIAGTITDLSPSLVEPLAAKLKQHAAEFRIAFNFSNLDRVADFQAIATLLDHYGIKRHGKQHRVGGGRVRVYSVDSEHLHKLKTVIARRQSSVTTPQNDLLNGGGESASDADKWTSPESLAEVRGWLLTEENSPDLQELLNLVPSFVKSRALVA